MVSPGVAARDRFLNALVPRLRRQVLALPGVVSTHQHQPNPMIVFTARKAVCVADALEALRYWQPQESWVSTRALDGDLSTFEGADVLVVEDLITSGRTITAAVDALRAAGASSVAFFSLAAESSQEEWQEQLQAPFIGPYLESTMGESFEFAESLIAAFAALPTPYNIDWPTYRLKSRFVRRHYLEMGWEVTSAGRRSYASAATFVPGQALTETILQATPKWFGQLLERTELAKVRAYPVPAHKAGSTRVILSPIVSLGELTEAEIRDVGSRLGELIGVEPLAGPPTEIYRAVQYVLGEMLVSLFLRSGGNDDLPIDQSHLNYLFVGSTRSQVAHAQIRAREFAVSHLCPDRPLGPRIRGQQWEEFIDAQEEAVRCDGLLTGIFLDRWVASPEHALREERRSAPSPKQRAELTGRLVELDRAEQGGAFAVTELTELLAGKLTESAPMSAAAIRERVSEFLDDAVDRGEVVPDIMVRSGVVGRVFRPGEVIDFQGQVAALTGWMLREFTTGEGGRPLSKDRLQKLLAAFFRFLHRQGQLREYGRPEDVPEGGVPLQRRFHIRGIVMDEVSNTDFVGSRGDTPQSARLLLDHNVIRQADDGRGYVVADREFKYVEQGTLNATAFGQVMARMLSVEGRRRRYVTDEEFFWLVTPPIPWTRCSP